MHVVIWATFLFYTHFLQAQGEANIWYFGKNAGLDFNSGEPVALTDGQMFAPEGSAVMSDASGQLLFYTNGVTVWNRNHETLQNGSGLQGGVSSTQSSLIIPKPGSNSVFYIFTTQQTQQAGNWNFCYSEVDMNLDGGLGGITANKNVLLYTPIGEKITAVKHANNTDIWIITHAKFTNAYLTYAVTSAGVNANPVIFNGGTVDNGNGEGWVSPNWGYLRASSDGSKVAAAFTAVNKVDILNFNRSTGQLSLWFTISSVDSPYGVEFSPNNQLLYISNLYGYFIAQYNLNLGIPSAIVSNVFLTTNPNPYAASALQLGPDERIYVSANQSTLIDCIQNPNTVGAACNYARNFFSLEGGKCWLGLPNFAPFYLVTSGIEYSGVCEEDSTFFTLSNAHTYDSIQWNFGDPASGSANTSNQATPYHIYQSPGSYLVTVNYFVSGEVFSVNRSISILEIPSISLGLDTFFCSFSTTLLDMEGFDINYQYTYSSGIYDDVFNLDSFFVYQEGLQWFTAFNSCGMSSDTISIQELSAPAEFNLPDGEIVFCETTSFAVSTAPSVGNYLWQDGSTEQVYSITQPGQYYVQVSNACGARADTMVVAALLPLPQIDLGNDTSLCVGNQILLNPQGIFDSFEWADGYFPTTVRWVDTSGTYVVSAYNSCGTAIDSLHLVVDSLPPVVSLGPDTSSCSGQTLTLSAAGNATSYVWQDGTSQSKLDVRTTGLYWVNASNGCGTASDSVFVRWGVPSSSTIVLQGCQPFMINGISYNQSGTYTQTLLNSSGCDSILTIEAEIQHFNAQIFQTDTTLYFNGNPTSIQWFNCSTGQVIPGATQTSFVPQITGIYGAVITIGECVDTSNCRLIPAPPIPQTPPDVCENIRVSPNPVSDIVSFTLDKDKYAIRLFSSTGGLIWQEAGTPEKQEIDFRNYAPAMYVLEVDQCRFKIIKQ
jgi:hypothetical protein